MSLLAAGRMARLAFEPLAFEQHANPGGGLEDISAEEAQAELANELIMLKITGKLSAKDVCTLMWWAERAGLPQGAATAFAMDPASTQSGHYNRHFNIVLGLESLVEDAYTIKIPGSTPMTPERTSLSIPCFPAHEVLDKEIEEVHDDVLDDFDNSIANRTWSAQYYEHPVVRNAAPSERVWPLALFCDKVPFQHRDSALVFIYI